MFEEWVVETRYNDQGEAYTVNIPLKSIHESSDKNQVAYEEKKFERMMNAPGTPKTPERETRYGTELLTARQSVSSRLI